MLKKIRPTLNQLINGLMFCLFLLTQLRDKFKDIIKNKCAWMWGVIIYSTKKIRATNTPILKVKPNKNSPRNAPIKSKRQYDIRFKSTTVRPVIIFLSGILFTLLFILVPYQIFTWYLDLPLPEVLGTKSTNKNTLILDRYGRLLFEINDDMDFENVNIALIPDHVIKSTLAIEDHEFYTHLGFRPLSIIRAARANILYDQVQGGSTITQQLVKNVLLSPEKTFTRKIKELVLSLFVEIKFSKSEILEMYLNNISYGGNSIGVQSASKKYFGKSVWDLDLAEATMLAGLPSAPSLYSPITGDFKKAKERQLYVLKRMVELRYITQEEADAALKKDLVFSNTSGYIRAPHFVSYVRDYLNSIYGGNYVDRGGLTVRTSLDLDLQEKIQSLVKSGVQKSSSLNINNGAALVLEKDSGEIIAYVGSADYAIPVWGKYDVVRAYRQPGSSIKPVTYALALMNGMKMNSKIKDEEIVIKTPWETYRPVNYDGKFHGEVTLKDALANSYNIPAVKLVQKFGASKMVDLAKKLGLASWDASDNDYGLSVTLGGKEVTLLELTNTYATFSRSGVYMNTSPIISVTDSNGYEIYRNIGSQLKVTEVLKPEIANDISTVLADNNARSPAFGSNSSLKVGVHKVSVKTGTTDNKKDNWTIGYDDKFIVGVWVGNNDNTPMNPRLASGLSGAAPIWQSIFFELLNN